VTTMAKRAPIKIGIAGLGRLGKRHATNLAYRVPGAELAAACSPVDDELDWARETLPEPRLYSDYEALLADRALDAVWLVTPSSLHAEQIVAALRAGKHVFCEKPLSLDVAECERVLGVAREYPALEATIGFMRRFDPSYRDAYEKAAAGKIGRPFMVRSQTTDQNDPDGFFVRFAPTSGGIFLDCTVHDIDVARWFFGGARATRAFATGTIALHEGLRECGDVDNGVGVVEFEGGRLAVFYASRTMAHGCDTHSEVIGTGGALSIGQNPRLNRVEIFDAGGVRSESTPTFFDRFEDAFLHEAQAFTQAVAARMAGMPAPAVAGATLADALEATRIGKALREACASGIPVTL
jgi:myo-inositol 2-dehydrogenase/D-chiro-inositol 1-dehydrogenase